MDLSVAAAQYFGASLWLTLGGALIISAAAFVVLRVYVWALFGQKRPPPQKTVDVEGSAPLLVSRTAVPLDIEIEPAVTRVRLSSFQSPTFQNAVAAFRRAICLYVVVGSIGAAAATALLFQFGFYTAPTTPSLLTAMTCYTAVFWSWSFFTVITLALFIGPDRRLRALHIIGYLGMLPVTGLLLELVGAPALPFKDIGLMPKDQADLLLSLATEVLGYPATQEALRFSPFLQPTLFWSLSAAPITLPLIAFNRFIRGTVGPLFINLAMTMLLSTLVIIDLVIYTSSGIRIAGFIKQIFADSTYVILWVISLTLSAVIAWRVLRWIVQRYRNKGLSDQTFDEGLYRAERPKQVAWMRAPIVC